MQAEASAEFIEEGELTYTLCIDGNEEILFAICEARGHFVDELISIKELKREARGGFADKIFRSGKEEHIDSKKLKLKGRTSMNEILSTISRRYSCRAYDGNLPEKEKLEALALAAIQSPSAMNRQPWQIIVITNKSLIEEMDAEGMRILAEAEDKTTYDRFMSRGGTLFYNAPCIYLILKQPGTDIDTGIVSENIALAATALGLGSVICGMAALPLNGPKGDEFKKILGFSDGWEFGIAVLVGYGKTDNAPHTPDTTKIRFVE